MQLFRSFLGLALFAGLAAASVEAAPQQGKKKQHGARGTVVSVHQGKNGKGTIEVRVHTGTGSKSQVAAQGKQNKKGPVVTFHVDSTTTFFKVGGKQKGQAGNNKQAATFRNVHKGEHVRIKSGGGKKHHASEVDVLARNRSNNQARAKK